MNEFLRKVAQQGQRNKKQVASITTPKATKTTRKVMPPELYQRTTIARVTARIKLRLKSKGVVNE